MKHFHFNPKTLLSFIGVSLAALYLASCNNEDMSKITVPQGTRSAEPASKAIKKRQTIELDQIKRLSQYYPNYTKDFFTSYCVERNSYIQSTKGISIEKMVTDYLKSADAVYLSELDTKYLNRLVADFKNQITQVIPKHKAEKFDFSDIFNLTSRPDINADIVEYILSSKQVDLINSYVESVKSKHSKAFVETYLKGIDGDKQLRKTFFDIAYDISAKQVRDNLDKIPFRFNAERNEINNSLEDVKLYLASLLSHAVVGYELVYLTEIGFDDCVARNINIRSKADALTKSIKEQMMDYIKTP